MSADPSKCPIPPGFNVIGDFSNDFSHFKNITGYDEWTDENDKKFGSNIGVSKRWKNPKIRSADIVCGFQFKVGPSRGERWFEDPTTGERTVLGSVMEGGISLHFPRREAPGGDRGGYLAGISWYIDDFNADKVIGESTLNKEIPHKNYGPINFLRHVPFRGKRNPRPMDSVQIRDGQWHSFLAVIYNDWHRDADLNNINPETNEYPLLSTSGRFPIIGLWYSHTPTFKFEDFTPLGMGVDLGNMPPRGPLRAEIGDDEIHDSNELLFGFHETLEIIGEIIGDGNVVGDELTRPEHALQIRIDDCPSNEIGLRNVYAASVRYIGIHPPQNPLVCNAQAKAVHDARAIVQDLESQAHADENHHLDTDIHVRLANARSDLSTAEFIYMQCLRRQPDIKVNCEPFEKAVKDAESEVKVLKTRIGSLQQKIDMHTLTPFEKKLVEKEINDIKSSKLSPAEARLRSAKIAFDNCMKGNLSAEHL